MTVICKKPAAAGGQDIEPFFYRLGEYVLFMGKQHQIISRIRFDHSERTNPNYAPGKKYYLLSSFGPPVKEEHIFKFELNDGC